MAGAQIVMRKSFRSRLKINLTDHRHLANTFDEARVETKPVGTAVLDQKKHSILACNPTLSD
jgi:hypothetical protein